MRKLFPFALAGLVLALLLPGRVASAQIRGTRFEIASVGDTTVSFARGTARWVKSGDNGIVIDQARRDALVARVRVMHVAQDSAVAVITGQTTRVTTSHVLLLQEPSRPWWKGAGFWGGLAAGAALGFLAGSQ